MKILTCLLKIRLFIRQLSSKQIGNGINIAKVDCFCVTVNRFEFHHTPKHGSWLNMAEIELSALGRQCLAQRIPNMNYLAKEVSSWENERNASVVKVQWRFTTADARIKLAHLYPRIQL